MKKMRKYILIAVGIVGGIVGFLGTTSQEAMCYYFGGTQSYLDQRKQACYGEITFWTYVWNILLEGLIFAGAVFVGLKAVAYIKNKLKNKKRKKK